MAKVAVGLAAVIVLLLVTFANPLVGNVLGFCPISEGPKAIGIDAIVATVDTSAAWLMYRGFRSYVDRIATSGSTDAARWAGARLAATAMRTAIAAPTTYASGSMLLSGMPMFSA